MAMFTLIILYASTLGAVNVLRRAIMWIMWRAIINASLFGSAAVWYLYLKRNVAAYFRELRRR